MNALIYLRSYILRYESVSWSHSRNSVNSDAFLVCSVISEVLSSEIRWLSAEERARAFGTIHLFAGCIWLVDGTI